jgi:hypothetical protein
MAASSFVIFASSFFTYAHYRFFGTSANLFYVHELEPQSMDQERQQRKLQENGYKVLLKIHNGKESTSRAFINSERLKRAESKEGLPVIYVKRNADGIQYIESYDELNIPWLWLILWIAFSIVSIWSWRLFASESASARR